MNGEEPSGESCRESGVWSGAETSAGESRERRQMERRQVGGSWSVFVPPWSGLRLTTAAAAVLLYLADQSYKDLLHYPSAERSSERTRKSTSLQNKSIVSATVAHSALIGGAGRTLVIPG